MFILTSRNYSEDEYLCLKIKLKFEHFVKKIGMCPLSSNLTSTDLTSTGNFILFKHTSEIVECLNKRYVHF